METLRQRRAFATVRLGMVDSLQGYKDELKAFGYNCGYNEGTHLLLDQIVIARPPRDVALVKVKLRELGFPRIRSIKETFPPFAAIEGRARGYGLDFCPAEAAPALRLAYM